MRLRTHGRYDYAPIHGRALTSGPTAAGLAVYIAVNLEHFLLEKGWARILRLQAGEPDVLNYAWRDYGNKVGVWRMLAGV